MTARPIEPPEPSSAVHVDVIVVGAGPTGLTAAGDLARAGRSVVVLERWAAPHPSSRAFTTAARTLEVLDARGLTDALLQQGNPVEAVTLFGGARIDLTRLPSRYPFVLVTPQVNVDRALGDYAARQGVTVVRGVEVVDLVQDGHGVTVTARPKRGDEPGHRTLWHAAYVIGADGAHSTVRELIGMPFPGKRVLSSVLLADVKLARGPSDGGLTLSNSRERFGSLAPYGRSDAEGSWFRSITWERDRPAPDGEPVGDQEIAALLTRTLGRDPGLLEVGSQSRFHCDERQVSAYRSGRVFLAGDAAHVHSPMGGQGMNAGIQDAANLAWKLAAVLDGADEAILQTYHAERHPVGQQVLRRSGLMLRSTVLRPRPLRLLRDLLAHRILAVPAVMDAVSGGLAGTHVRYPHRPEESDLVGTRATEVPLAQGRLTKVQRQAGFVLVREQGVGPLSEEALAGAAVTQAQRTDAGPALLVRPDGYVAWAGSLRAPGSGPRWQDVLAGWTSPTLPNDPDTGVPSLATRFPHTERLGHG